MKVKFENIIEGLNRYLDKEIYINLNDLQEIAARLVVGRINGNIEAVKKAIMSNGYIKTFGLIDNDGMVDIDSLLMEVKREIERKGKVQFEIPLIGKMTFVPGDVEVIKNYIYGR